VGSLIVAVSNLDCASPAFTAHRMTRGLGYGAAILGREISSDKSRVVTSA